MPPNLGDAHMPKRGDADQYGYDPKRQAAKTLLDRLEHAADQRPARPARKLGDVLKLPKVTPTTKRLIDSSVRISADPPTLIDFQHTVFCQVGLPYRPTRSPSCTRSCAKPACPIGRPSCAAGSAGRVPRRC